MAKLKEKRKVYQEIVYFLIHRPHKVSKIHITLKKVQDRHDYKRVKVLPTQ
jgi:hypothetical protein